MSFGGSAAEPAIPKLKSFVTEDEIEEKKQKRQEEWEKVRKPEDPMEAPEEEYDPRCLFERLQEQKDKKEAEFAEAHALKNQISGLDEDEAQFLDYVSDRQQEITKEREEEEWKVLREYRNSVASSVSEASDSKKPEPKKQAPSVSQTRKSQLSLLAGAVKRKSTDTQSTNESSAKKTKADTESSASGGQVATVAAVLPGLGAYSASSDSASSSSDSEPDTRLFAKPKTGGCSHAH